MGTRIMESIFSLKMTSKQLVKASKRCEKEEKSEKLKGESGSMVVTHPQLPLLVVLANAATKGCW